MKLTKEQKKILKRRCFEDVTDTDIAAELGVSTKRVRKWREKHHLTDADILSVIGTAVECGQARFTVDDDDDAPVDVQPLRRIDIIKQLDAHELARFLEMYHWGETMFTCRYCEWNDESGCTSDGSDGERCVEAVQKWLEEFTEPDTELIPQA